MPSPRKQQHLSTRHAHNQQLRTCSGTRSKQLRFAPQAPSCLRCSPAAPHAPGPSPSTFRASKPSATCCPRTRLRCRCPCFCCRCPGDGDGEASSLEPATPSNRPPPAPAPPFPACGDPLLALLPPAASAARRGSPGHRSWMPLHSSSQLVPVQLPLSPSMLSPRAGASPPFTPSSSTKSPTTVPVPPRPSSMPPSKHGTLLLLLVPGPPPADAPADTAATAATGPTAERTRLPGGCQKLPGSDGQLPGGC